MIIGPPFLEEEFFSRQVRLSAGNDIGLVILLPQEVALMSRKEGEVGRIFFLNEKGPTQLSKSLMLLVGRRGVEPRTCWLRVRGIYPLFRIVILFLESV